ncbi:hypothetical protein K457DRAFT_567178 [Linnemannia elongata AG-77]|uniref:Uncharacterized protein n=1 Tax=Linnemannia elongata AG-77 TaxID=1314771 RepID=A0A197JV86_9FUNG|nr:hypothetical protein K457DRAFT_567178 [Linnemannia elongata AG-77]
MSRLQHELYIEQRSLDQYDAVDFFDFCGFSSDQRQNAVFIWKTIILPEVLQRDSAQHKRLITTWSHSKRARQKYWNDKQKKEERDAQLDDHIEHIRDDTIKQTQLVSGSITRDVGERLKAISPSSSVGSDTWKHGSHSTISLKSNSASIPASVDNGEYLVSVHVHFLNNE